MKKYGKKGKVAGAVFGAAIMLLFSPLLSFVMNTGTYVGMSVGAAVVLLSVFFDYVAAAVIFLWKHIAGKAALSVLAFLFAVLLVAFSVELINVLSHAECDYVPEGATVVVLGCKVKDGKPGKMLRGRLDKAEEYLASHPGAYCVVSGGQGDDEAVSEAAAMREYLLSHGVPDSRIFTEEKSYNTETNMKYTSEVIAANGLSTEIAVVSDFYHQYRAARFASDAGLDAYPVSMYYGIFSAPTFVLREICGLLSYDLQTLLGIR